MTAFLTSRFFAWAVLLFFALILAPHPLRSSAAEPAPEKPRFGAQEPIGCRPDAKRLDHLSITSPGVYENLLIDGAWIPSTLVKITADDVTLRHCEIRNGMHNAVTIAAKNIVIDCCRIHHVLAGTFQDPRDAHGITGHPTNLTIRNCDIGLVSGDAIQFDPGRGPWGDVRIENCTLWTGPLPADAAQFKRGQRPGENAVDTKQYASNSRSRLTIKGCLIYGWNQPGQMTNMAALNLKNHVEARVENCLLRDNEICFRLRGGADEYGGALVTIDNCLVYDSLVAVRAENSIRDLKINRLGIGASIKTKFLAAGGGPGPGYENTNQYDAPSLP
jgi:hypothetical protein